MAEYGSHIVSISPAGQLRLEKIAAETGRKIESLIAAAAEEEALNYFRHRNDDPVREARRVIDG